MAHPPVRWTDAMIATIAGVLGDCAAQSPWTIAAAAIEETHFHVALTHSPLDIDRTIKWIGQEMTKAVHLETPHAGPVFCKGRWRQFIFEPSHWRNVIRYIEQHNLRRGLLAKPYAFIDGTARG